MSQIATQAAARPAPPPARLGVRAAVVVLSLAAGLAYRVSVSLIANRVVELVFVLTFGAVLLGLGLLARRGERFEKYWPILYGFGVFAVAGFFGDGSISPFQHFLVANVLRETTSANNPLGSTVAGSVLSEVAGTLLLAIPILVLTRLAGDDLRSIFVSAETRRWGLALAIVVFGVIYFLAIRGRTESFFPTHGEMSPSRVLSLTPALVVLVLLNGFREELWFRGLFLKKYALFLRPLLSNVLAAVIFTSFHVQVQYSASIVVFLVYTLVIGLVLGWLMQRTQSLLAPTILHAGTDIPIFLVYLSYVSP